MVIDQDLSVAADADLIAVPAHTVGPVDERYLDVIRAAEARGAWVLSVCSGAFVLAPGRHPRRTPRRPPTGCTPTGSRERYPLTDVDPDVLFVEDRQGRHERRHRGRHRRRPAHRARASTAPPPPTSSPAAWWCRPQRDGGQSQYIESPMPERRSDSFALGDRVDAGEPRRGPHDRPARPPRAHVDPHLRPQVPRRARHDAGRLAQPSADPARAAAARGDRRGPRADRAARPASAPHPSCATTSSRCWRPTPTHLPPRVRSARRGLTELETRAGDVRRTPRGDEASCRRSRRASSRGSASQV